MNILKDSLKSFFWNVLGSIISFMFQILAAKFLGAKYFGEANYYYGFSATISIFTNFGVQFYLPKYIHVSKNKDNIFSETFCTLSLIYIFFAPIMFFILMYMMPYFQIVILLGLAYCMLMIEIIVSYYVAVGNTALGMFYKRFIYSVFNIIFFIILFKVIKKGYIIYLYSMMISYLIIIVPICIKNINKISINLKIVSFVFKYYIIQIMYGLYLALSKVLQGKYGSFESVAVLSIALTIGSATSMLGESFAKVSMVQISKAWKENDLVKLRIIFRSVSRMNSFLVLPIAVFVIMNSKKILLLLGKDYAGGEIILVLILFSQFINSFVGPNGTVLTMTNKSNYEIINGIIKLIISVIVYLFFGAKYYWGIALSIAFSEVLVNILKIIELKKAFDIFPYSSADIMFMTFLFLTEGIVFYIASIVTNLFFWIVLNGIVGLAFYYISFQFSPHSEDKSYIDHLKRKFLGA